MPGATSNDCRSIAVATVLTYSFFTVILAGFSLGVALASFYGGVVGKIVAFTVSLAIAYAGYHLTKLTLEKGSFIKRVLLWVVFIGLIPFAFYVKGALNTGAWVFYAFFLISTPVYLNPREKNDSNDDDSIGDRLAVENDVD